MRDMTVLASNGKLERVAPGRADRSSGAHAVLSCTDFALQHSAASCAELHAARTSLCSTAASCAGCVDFAPQHSAAGRVPGSTRQRLGSRHESGGGCSGNYVIPWWPGSPPATPLSRWHGKHGGAGAPGGAGASARDGGRRHARGRAARWRAGGPAPGDVERVAAVAVSLGQVPTGPAPPRYSGGVPAPRGRALARDDVRRPRRALA